MSATPKAPISSLKILLGALAVIPLRFGVFARALAIPFALFLVFDGVWLLPTAVTAYERFPWVMYPLVQLLNLACYSLVAVPTHRVILVGASAVPHYGIEWTRHTTRFFTFALLLTCVSYAAGLALSQLFGSDQAGDSSFFVGLMTMGALALWVALTLVIARLLLVFPASAVGKPITLSQSWELTRGRKLLMCLIAVVYPTLIGLLQRFIATESARDYWLGSLASFLVLTVTVILLSFAYQQILKERGGT